MGPRKRRLAEAFALCAWLLAGCGGAPPEPPARPIVIVSVLPHAWLVERLGGDAVEIVVMIPPGASPATHEPELAQLTALARASFYVKVGHPHFPFEAAWLDRLLAERPDLPVIDAAEGLGAREHDPHLWLSPARMLALVGPVADALVAALPDEDAAIRAREAALRSEVTGIDDRLRGILAGARGKSFLVLHPAWGHLADEHGLVQLAIQRENREPDPHHMAALIERARALGIEVVFTQPHFDENSARVVAAEIRGRVETLDPLAADWAANLVHVAERLAAAARG